jgi:hypothetical protein
MGEPTPGHREDHYLAVMIFPTPPTKVNQKVLFLVTLSVCLLPGGRREMTLSFTELREIERAVLSKVCPLDAEARLVCLTLINHHNVKDGTCNPSIPTLVDKTGLGETTVRGRLWKLVEEGCLEMARFRPRATYDFKLKMPPWAEEARAARCRQGAEGMSDRPTAEAESSPRDESSRCEPSSAEPEQDSKILLTEKNRAQRGVQTRQLMRAMPSEVQPLARIMQGQGVAGTGIRENQRLAGKVKSCSGAFFSSQVHVSVSSNGR